MLGITVGSNKSLIGEGTSGVIKGRGLRIVNGVENVIVQYVQYLSLF
jgi:pectin lyase